MADTCGEDRRGQERRGGEGRNETEDNDRLYDFSRCLLACSQQTWIRRLFLMSRRRSLNRDIIGTNSQF